MKTIHLVLITFLLIIHQTSGFAQVIKDSQEKIKERRKTERTSNTLIESHIDELLAKMTIEEKIGQMIQVTVDVLSDTKEFNETESGITEIKLNPEKLKPFLEKYPIGSIINGYGFSPENWHEFYTQLQETNKQTTRLAIPILQSQDHQHGANYVAGATIFPHSLNMASTFNRELIEKETLITGIETADLGHRWILSPIGDLGCNPLWPRIFETYGEDPYLTSELCRVQIRARKNNSEIAPYKQVGCAKHFLAYSDPRAGWDRTPTDISTQTLYEKHIPPFKVIIDEGVEAVMLNSGELNGEAVHGSHNLVNKLLRDELGFKGVVITDWNDILKMIQYHKAARNEKEATLKAINAGIDITMEPTDLSFGDVLIELVNEGKVSEERIDLSVARILRMKMLAGLFDNPASRDDRLHKIGCKEHLKVAKQAAEESIVLLKNEKILPLKNPVQSIVLAGPNANIKRSLCGGWTFRWWPQNDSIFPKDMETVYTALQKEFGKNIVSLATSEDIESKSTDADVIVLALGEMPHAEGFGNTNNLSLDDDQTKLVEKAIETKKPLIIVMIGARPLICTNGFDHAEAFIWAGLPGVQGGSAIAKIISGRTNPSGKLSFSYPAFNGHYYNYNHKPSHSNYDIPPVNPRTLIASFGDGLSYSDFSYSNLHLSDSILFADSSIIATIDIENTSSKDGKETVLWYINDEYASITRPVKELKFFEKSELKAGEKKSFSFKIDPSMLYFPDNQGNQIIEDGYFTIFCVDQMSRFKLDFKK